MRPWTKLYLSSFGYDVSDFVPCEVSGQKAVDIHHIIPRSENGEDRIENLMALTRKEHAEKGDKKSWKAWLFKVHLIHLRNSGVEFDEEFINQQIQRWEEYANN